MVTLLPCVRWALRAPKRVLAAAGLVVLAVAPGLWRLELRTDGRALVPTDDPAVRADAEIRAHFQLRDQTVVLLESRRPEGIFHTDFLRRVVELTKALGELPEVGPQQVVSLATEPSDRVAPTGDSALLRLLEPLPTTAEDMARLRRDLDAISILDGTLVSADRRAATVLAGTADAADRTAILDQVRAVAQRFAGAETAVHVVGAPVAQALLGRHIFADLLLLVPLSVAAVAIVVWWFCRRLAAVAIALAKIGGTLVFVAGLMGLVGAPVYLTTAILPVLLVTLALADEIHLLSHCQKGLLAIAAAKPDPAPAETRTAWRAATLNDLERAFGGMLRAITLTSLTTSVGFGSFLASDLTAVRLLGVFAPAGILFCLLWSLTVTPALLAVFGPDALARHDAAIVRRTRRMSRAAALIGRRAGLLSGLLLAVSGVAAYGSTLVRVQDSWVEGFAEGSEFRRSAEYVQTKLFGTHSLLLAVEAEPPTGVPLPSGLVHAGPLLDPIRLEAIRGLEAAARRQPGVGGVLGLHSQLVALAYVSGAPTGRSIAPRAEEIERLVRLFGTARGDQRRREMLDDAMRRTVVLCLLQNANYQDTARIMAALRAHEAEHLAPLGMRLEFGGDIAVSQAMIPAIVRTQLASMLLSIGLNVVVLWIAFRSLIAAVTCVLPAICGALWVFGSMGFLAIPLGVATSMFCAISIGVGVDYAIHLRERIAAAATAGAPDATTQGLADSTPANVADAVAIALGFGLLLGSRVPANARLGLLVALALLSACTLTVFGLGAIHCRWLRSGPER